MKSMVGKDAKISRVLNGMVYAVIGIYEYCENTGDEEARGFLRKVFKALSRISQDTMLVGGLVMIIWA